MSQRSIKNRHKPKARLRYPPSVLRIMREAARPVVSLLPPHIIAKHFYEDGPEQDYEQAYLWFSKGANLENAEAMYGLSLMYLCGDYVDVDDIEGIYWLRRSAELHYLDATQTLFEIYFDEKSPA